MLRLILNKCSHYFFVPCHKLHVYIVVTDKISHLICQIKGFECGCFHVSEMPGLRSSLSLRIAVLPFLHKSE